jgi:DNA-3-methyladenine glycosylase II
MRKAGLSGQKTEYIRDLARHARDGRVRFEELPELADEEVMARLTAVKGIGVWTVHMFLIFALRRHDVLPTGDLGIRNAIRQAYGLEALPLPAKSRRWPSGGAHSARWQAGIFGGASSPTPTSD